MKSRERKEGNSRPEVRRRKKAAIEFNLFICQLKPHIDRRFPLIFYLLFIPTVSIYFLSLGSNINPAENIPRCVQTLQNYFPTMRSSSFYETDPVGPSGNRQFWNAVVSVETNLEQVELEEKIKQIENELGRKRDPNNKFAPRPIDIDLLPQDSYWEQAFILIPLAEIAPNSINKETNCSYLNLVNKLSDSEKQKCRKVRIQEIKS